MRHSVFVVALLTLCPGCLACFTTHQVEVAVTNRATGEPLVQAQVGVFYPTISGLNMLVLNRPQPDKGTTDGEGRVSLRMADFRNGPILLRVDDHDFWLEGTSVEKGGSLEEEGLAIRLSRNSGWPVIVDPFLRIRDLFRR